jgi:hypothetical protein
MNVLDFLSLIVLAPRLVYKKGKCHTPLKFLLSSNPVSLLDLYLMERNEVNTVPNSLLWIRNLLG